MRKGKLSKLLSLALALAMAFSLAMTANAAGDGSVSITDVINMGARVTDTSATGLHIESTWEGFNPIIVKDSDYTINDAYISIDSDGDGTVTCDFSGLGAAIAAYGDSVLRINNSTVNVSGVANLALFADDGADVIIKNSKFHSDGGTLYEGYLNSPDQSTMVAPPWILGIMGTSRTTNLMGTDSSTTVIDSDMSAAQWAILSTDSGTNMKLNVVNTTMSLTGADYPIQAGGTFDTEYGATGAAANPYTSRAGYGTYTIGDADERFYGVDMTVGTYANILTGGSATYTSLQAGTPVDLVDANGNLLETYIPTESKTTTINSDTFGFMAHQGTDTLSLLNNTVVTSGYTSILHKTGCDLTVTVDNSTLNPGNGILIQAMDNDDTTTGMDMGTFSFYTTHEEYSGWPTVGADAAGSNTGVYNLNNVRLTGDIFNATGWESNSSGAQSPIAMTINLTGSSTLEGQISSTAAIHVTKAGSDAVKAAPAGKKASEDWLQYQNISFPIGHYFDIGQVANRIQSNTYNTIDVNVEPGSVWTVTGNGIVNNVTAASDGIVASTPVTLYVAGTLTLDGQPVDLTAGDHTVGNVTYTRDTSTATKPTEPGEGEGGEGGGPGGEGGMMPPGGDSEPQVWYTEDDKLTLAVLDGVVVAPGTEGATEYTVDRLMYGTADNLSSFSDGGHDPNGDDDYAFITALYVKDGAVQPLTATPVGGTEDPGTDEEPGTEDPGTEQPGTEDPGTGTEAPGTGTEKPSTGAQKPATSTTTTSPKTGDTAMPFVIGGVGILALAALVVLFVLNKRRTRG